MSIYDLISRILSGDSDAEERFAGLYLEWLSERARRRYRYLDPDALVQDAFVYFLKDDAAVLRRFHDSHPPASDYEPTLKKYLWDSLCGIASNHLRTEKRKPLFLVDPAEQVSEADIRPTPEARAISRDAAEKLIDCVAKGGSRILLLYRLEFQQDKTTQEIAAMLNLEVRKVYDLRQSLRARAKRCRELLGL